MDGITELAKMLRERDNMPYSGAMVGIVMSPPPTIKVALGDKIILDREQLVISAHVLQNYSRQAEVTSTSGDLSFHLKNNPPSNDYTLTNLSTQTTINYTDTLKTGDEVILIPSRDEQTFFLIDKAVRL